jgi:hypothetical protein
MINQSRGSTFSFHADLPGARILRNNSADEKSLKEFLGSELFAQRFQLSRMRSGSSLI